MFGTNWKFLSQKMRICNMKVMSHFYKSYSLPWTDRRKDSRDNFYKPQTPFAGDFEKKIIHFFFKSTANV